jgi:hypothetical protein
VESVPFLQDGVAEGEVVRFVTDAALSARPTHCQSAVKTGTVPVSSALKSTQ